MPDNSGLDLNNPQDRRPAGGTGPVVRKVFYRVREVMDLLNFGRTKVYGLIHSGTIPSFEIGGEIRVPVDQLHEWIKHQIDLAQSNARTLREKTHPDISEKTDEKT